MSTTGAGGEQVSDTRLYHDTCHHKIYFLSCEQFDALRDFAGAECQICGLPEAEAARGRLVIDHMNDYGKHAVRGLLCDRCNMLMLRVDNCVQEEIPMEVYTYRENAWFARMTSPRGPLHKWPTEYPPWKHLTIREYYARKSS